jgi:RimJ/RimL family protein N-acetyltransferase
VPSRGRSRPKGRTKEVDVAGLPLVAAVPAPAMTYQIHRYPAELIDVVHLTDGERVIIRPVLPQDRELMVAFFNDLSTDARCSRFMHPVSEPSSELLRQFTQVDYANHVALVAEIFVDRRETVIGEARYVRAADPSSAEISVSMSELWRGKGLAKLMLTKLERHAAAAGVRRIIGYTLGTNERLLSLARKAGFVIWESAKGVIRLEKTLALGDHKRPWAVFEFVVDDSADRS